MDNKTIAEMLIKEMETKNMSRRKLALLIGITDSTITSIVNGRTHITPATIAKINKYFNIGTGEDMSKIELARIREQEIELYSYKHQSIDIAKDFRYGEDVYAQIKAAKSIGEINRIMHTARDRQK